MTWLRVIVDSDTIFDGDPGQWTDTPPKLEALLANRSNPALYVRCLLLVIAEAAITDAQRVVTVTTTNRYWTMRVRDK